jgi:PAS domain S-box-containing protein
MDFCGAGPYHTARLMTVPPSDPNLPPVPPAGDSGLTRLAFVRQIAGQLADRADPAPAGAAVHPAEKALDESRRLLELFFAQSLDGFFFMMLDEPVRWDESVDKEAVLDYVFAHQRVTRVNRAMAAQYGAPPEVLLGRTPAEFFAHDPASGRTMWREFFDVGRLHVETHERKLDGTPIWIEGDYICLYAPDGRIMGHFGIQRDITARRRAEEALRFSEEKFAKAFRACPFRVSIGTLAEGRFIEVNDAFLRDHGFTREQVIGRTSPELGLWGDPGDRRRLIEALERGEMVRDFEFQGQTRDGQVQITSLSAELIRVGGETCLLAVATDVTDRKRAEEELRRSHEELRALAARLQSVREDERTRIAREVHDELGQALTGLKLDLAWLKPRLRDQVSLLERVQAVVGRIDGTIDAVRRIATELRPSVLDHLGLVAAVEWQAQEFEKLTGVVVRLSLSSAGPAVDGTVATTVFRMLQETLTNVARHAAATSVEIVLEVRHEAITLRVADNGRGISATERTNPHSLGLVGLRERAIACAGELVIEGRPGEGTIVTVRIPLPLAAVVL